MVLCPTWAFPAGSAFLHRNAFDPDPQLVTVRQACDDAVQVSFLVEAEGQDRLLLQRISFSCRSGDLHLAINGQPHVQLHHRPPGQPHWYLTGDGEVIPNDQDTLSRAGSDRGFHPTEG